MDSFKGMTVPFACLNRKSEILYTTNWHTLQWPHVILFVITQCTNSWIQALFLWPSTCTCTCTCTSTCIFINTTSTDTTVNPQAVFPLKKQQMFLDEINQLLNMLGDKMGPHLPSVLNIILILANSCSQLLSELRNEVSED